MHRCIESCLFAKPRCAIREFMRTDAGSSSSLNALAFFSALAFAAGCGGGGVAHEGTANNANGSASSSGAESQARCDLSPETIARWRSFHADGSRVLVALPDEALLAEGNTVYVIPACTSFVGVVEAPPSMVSEPAFIASNMDDLRTTHACQDSPAGLVCSQESGFLVARPLRTQGGAAVILAVAPTVEDANHLLDGVRFDSALPFDAVHALGLHQPAPEGMSLHPLSQAHLVIYTPEGASPDAATTPTLLWTYETGTEREIGVELGQMAVRQLGVSQLGEVIPVGDASPEAFMLMAQGTHGTSPVTVIMGLFRQEAGAFVFIARVPSADAALWIQRIRAQADVTQTLR